MKLRNTISVSLMIAIIFLLFPNGIAEYASGDVNFNNHSYKVFDISLSWTEAQMYCEGIGGHLVTINSEEENDFILQNIKGKNCYWIGLKLDQRGKLNWVTGEDVTYNHFEQNEPDNYENKQGYCLILARNADFGWRAGFWSDGEESGESWDNNPFWGKSNFGFICEWEPVDSVNIKNLSLNRSLCASSELDYLPISNANDDDVYTYWESIGYPAEVIIDCQMVSLIDSVKIRLNPESIWEARSQNIEVLSSTDGQNYKQIVKPTTYKYDPKTGNQININFDATETRYIKLVFANGSWENGAQAAEIAILGQELSSLPVSGNDFICKSNVYSGLELTRANPKVEVTSANR